MVLLGPPVLAQSPPTGPARPRIVIEPVASPPALSVPEATPAPPRLTEPDTTPAPKPGTVVEPNEDNLLLLALELDRSVLSDELDGYSYPKGVLLPLGEICRLLGIGITVTPSKGTAEGFIIREERLFSLNCALGEVSVGGRPARWDATRIEVHPNDIYVDSALLSEWLPIALEVDRNASMIRVSAREPLPIQMRMERERRLAQTRAYLPPRDPGYPRLDLPYRMAAFPAIDQSASFTLGMGSRSGTARYSALAVGELLRTTASMYAAAGAGQPAIARFTFSRNDPDARLLGGLHASQVSFGDTPTASVPLVSMARPGTGLAISNHPLNLQTQDDSHSFQGNLQAGWDVELYREEALLGYQAESGSGRYEFNDVPLLMGMNRFRLVFNGPHGERREEEYRFYVGDQSMEPREGRYRVSLHREGSGRLRLGAQYDVGLTKGMNAGLALQTLSLNGIGHRYLSAGVRRSWNGIFGRLDVASDLGHGWAAETGLQTRLGKIDVSLHQSVYSDFIGDDLVTSSRPLDSRTQLRLEGVPMPRRWYLLPAGIEILRERARDGSTRWEATVRSSAYVQRTWISHHLSWERYDVRGGASTSTGRGTLLASRRVRGLDVRAQVDYELTPAWRLRSLSATATRSASGNKLVTLTVSRTLGGGTTLVSLGLTQQFSGMSLSAGAANEANGAGSTNLALTGGMLIDPRSGRWLFSQRSVTTAGALSTRVFFDRNLNGKMDPGEEPIRGARFLVNGTANEAVTDSRGCALIAGLPPYLPADISISSSSLDDITWTPRLRGVRVVARPGAQAAIDFPIVGTGEISGTLYREVDGAKRPAAGIQLELVGDDGKVERAVRSAFDGFYSIPGIPPGRYTLRVATADTARLQLAPIAPRSIEIAADGTVLDGVDFTVPAAPAQP